MEKSCSNEVFPTSSPNTERAKDRGVSIAMGKGDTPPLTYLLVEKLSRSLNLKFEVALLSVLVTFSTYMRAKTIDGYYFTQKATLWGLLLHRSSNSKVSTLQTVFKSAMLLAMYDRTHHEQFTLLQMGASNLLRHAFEAVDTNLSRGGDPLPSTYCQGIGEGMPDRAEHCPLSRCALSHCSHSDKFAEVNAERLLERMKVNHSRMCIGLSESQALDSLCKHR